MRGAFTRRRVTVAAAAVIAAAVSAAVAGAWWVSSVNALSFTGTGGGGAVGMRILRNTGGSDYVTADEAPPEFGWRRGGYVFYSFFFEDTLRIPITVTGLTGYDTANAGMVGTPRLYVPRPPLTDAEDLAHIVPLHDLRIGPGEDGMRAIVMVWRLRGPCARVAGSTTTGWTGEQIDGIHLRYTVLGGLFSETQWVPMQLSETLDGTPGYLFGVRSPRRSDCPAGYPPPRTS